MKRIYFVLLIVFVVTRVCAQENLIGKSKTVIDSATNAGQGKQIVSGVATDTHLPYLGYKFPDGKMELYYFDKDDICYQCAFLYPHEQLDVLVAELNKKYKKQEGGNIWMRADNKLKVQMLIQKSLVSIKYTSL